MKKVSILGCGWLGLPLAKRMLGDGYVVSGSTTRAERLPELIKNGIQPFQLKAENGKWVGEDLANFLNCDILIIAIPPGTKRNPHSTHAEEIQDLMLYISELEVEIKKIIYISSTSVYKNNNTIVEENDLIKEDHAENKVLFRAEQHVLTSAISEKLVFRLGGLTGYERMLGRFFAGKTDLAGGNEPVNLVHRDDVIAVVMFLLKKDRGTMVLNVCSPEHPTRRDFYTQLCNRFSLDAPAFPISLDADWKEISSRKLDEIGYMWIFSDPHTFSYTY